MNIEAVENAVTTAVRDAFLQARRNPKDKGGQDFQRSLTYAKALIMPLVEMAVNEALEEGFRQAKNGGKPS